MHTCTVRLVFPRDRRDEALWVLRSLVGPVRAQSGCARTRLMTDVQDDLVLTWVSRWRTRDDLERHLRSSHFRRILAVIDLAAEPPRVEFECETDMRGLDLIDEVLGGTDELRTPQSTDLDPNTPT